MEQSMYVYCIYIAIFIYMYINMQILKDVANNFRNQLIMYIFSSIKEISVGLHHLESRIATDKWLCLTLSYKRFMANLTLIIEVHSFKSDNHLVEDNYTFHFILHGPNSGL